MQLNAPKVLFNWSQEKRGSAATVCDYQSIIDRQRWSSNGLIMIICPIRRYCWETQLTDTPWLKCSHIGIRVSESLAPWALHLQVCPWYLYELFRTCRSCQLPLIRNFPSPSEHKTNKMDGALARHARAKLACAGVDRKGGKARMHYKYTIN